VCSILPFLVGLRLCLASIKTQIKLIKVVSIHEKNIWETRKWVNYMKFILK